mmetsp:Transcript_31616/g.74407  ORF Transcript_31616/g.74407 Transcript_31616/m.74407 type:complete len:223 (-) Transcript_31616:846-1514(-)
MPVVLWILLVLGRLERNRPFREFDHALVLRCRHVKSICHFFVCWGSSHPLLKATSNLSNPVHHVVNVNRKTNRSRVVRNRSENSLLNPPRRIRGKLETLGGIKFFGGPGQSQTSFLNQILQTHSHLGVFLCNGNDQSHVRLDHELLRTAASQHHLAEILHGPSVDGFGAGTTEFLPRLPVHLVNILGDLRWRRFFGPSATSSDTNVLRQSVANEHFGVGLFK